MQKDNEWAGSQSKRQSEVRGGGRTASSTCSHAGLGVPQLFRAGIPRSVCSPSQRCSSSGLCIRGAVCKNNCHPRIVLVSSVFHLKPNEKWGNVCYTCLILLLSATLFLSSLVWKNGSLHMRGWWIFLVFFFFCWSNFSVIYHIMLLCFLTHLVPDHADLQSLIFVTAGWSPGQPSWGTQWKGLDPQPASLGEFSLLGAFRLRPPPKTKAIFICQSGETTGGRIKTKIF